MFPIILLTVLKQIANYFGITVNDLLGDNDVKKKKIDLKSLVQTKTFILALSIGLVCLVATIVYVGLAMFNVLPSYNWLVFCSIISVVFFAIWKKTIPLTISESVLVWTLALSFCLSIQYDKIWFILIIATPLQILIILWNWFRNKKKHVYHAYFFTQNMSMNLFEITSIFFRAFFIFFISTN